MSLGNGGCQNEEMQEGDRRGGVQNEARHSLEPFLLESETMASSFLSQSEAQVDSRANSCTAPAQNRRGYSGVCSRARIFQTSIPALKERKRKAEIADERKKLGLELGTSQSSIDSQNSQGEFLVSGDAKQSDGKRYSRPKDVFGKTVPTEEEFPVLKNAPRLETGIPARARPFAIEVRNVKCARCGVFGHQSGDRECLMKDMIMPQEEARLKRDDPLTTIMNHTINEPLKWEMKHQLGGLSPARGGFKPEDPNQQIIPEDIYDEYGGFLAVGGDTVISNVLASLSCERHHNSRRKHGKKKEKKSRDGKGKKKRKLKRPSSTSASDSNSDYFEYNLHSPSKRHLPIGKSNKAKQKSKQEPASSSKGFHKSRKHEV